ncbi:putative nucleic-acid-binding protein implicated in transcription termination [Xenococcus sp. PCC 7305]|uniref:YlxR family protein n=1 Tax=Xenococcus sp. PCC 7305 TaxID=102125 RepID=UPI0002ABBE3A|nr:YlxR family protein [Xenococcus sp. PCC 7305]ELS00631.1 putative nucleic-acid-binding protein implicated in transcription termination [Xenococcus sp. PCC 7305]
MKINYRRCISCKKTASKEEFWRIVRLQGSCEIILDQGIGRSAYICPKSDCLQKAQRKNLLKRALRAMVPQGIYDLLQQRLIAEM